MKIYGWYELNICACSIDEEERDVGPEDFDEQGELDILNSEHPGTDGDRDSKWFRTFRIAKKAAIDQIQEEIQHRKLMLRWLRGQKKESVK